MSWAELSRAAGRELAFLFSPLSSSHFLFSAWFTLIMFQWGHAKLCYDCSCNYHYKQQDYWLFQSRPGCFLLPFFLLYSSVFLFPLDVLAVFVCLLFQCPTVSHSEVLLMYEKCTLSSLLLPNECSEVWFWLHRPLKLGLSSPRVHSYRLTHFASALPGSVVCVRFSSLLPCQFCFLFANPSRLKYSPAETKAEGKKKFGVLQNRAPGE